MDAQLETTPTASVKRRLAGAMAAVALTFGSVGVAALPAAAAETAPSVHVAHDGDEGTGDKQKLSKNEKFVKNAYKDFLGRWPSDGDITYWSGLLDSGQIDRADLTWQLANSDEWLYGVIAGFYWQTLGREPDRSGLDYWVAQARAGYPIELIASEFYASPEYFARTKSKNSVWIKDLYRQLMSRDADQGGVDYWLGQLDAGASRTTVAYAFYQSDEKLYKRVKALYKHLLDRKPDDAGASYWAGVVWAEGDLALATWLAASDEYFNGSWDRKHDGR